MIEFLKKVKSNDSFIGNIAKISTGTLIAQLIAIALSPLISRLYTPEQYGVFSIFTSMLTTITVISCLRYDLTIMIPKKESEANNLYILAVFMSFLTSSVTLLLMLLFGDKFADFFNYQKYSAAFMILPLAVFIAGLNRATTYFLTRKRLFTEISAQRVIKTSSTGILQVFFSFITEISNTGLIFGAVFGRAIGTVFLTYISLRKYIVELFSNFSIKTILSKAKEYINFPIFSSFSELSNVVSTTLPNFVLSYYFGANISGYYALGYRIMSLPMVLIGASIGQVFLQKTIEMNDIELKISVSQILKGLLTVGLVPMTLIALNGEIIFSLAFGSEWARAGIYISYLAPWLFMVFIASPISVLYISKQKQKLSFMVNIIMLLSRIGILLYFGSRFNDLTTVVAYGIGGFVLWILNLMVLIKLSKNSVVLVFSDLLYRIFKQMKYLILPILLCIFNLNSVFCLVISIIFGVVFIFIELKNIFELFKVGELK